MSRVARTPFWGFPIRSDTNRAVQSQKMARPLKFRISEVEGLYYLCNENKGADDLRLCFRICKEQVFSCRCSYDTNSNFYQNNTIYRRLFIFFFSVYDARGHADVGIDG